MAFDTSYLYFRAYFGVPSSFRAPDGTPVNAVRGTLDFIARLVQGRSDELLSLLCLARPIQRVPLLIAPAADGETVPVSLLMRRDTGV